MEEAHRRSLLDFLDDLTDAQVSRLVYICLNCTINETARRRKTTKQAISHSIQLIHDKRNHQELIAAMQEALCKGGFLLEQH